MKNIIYSIPSVSRPASKVPYPARVYDQNAGSYILSEGAKGPGFGTSAKYIEGIITLPSLSLKGSASGMGGAQIYYTMTPEIISLIELGINPIKHLLVTAPTPPTPPVGFGIVDNVTSRLNNGDRLEVRNTATGRIEVHYGHRIGRGDSLFRDSAGIRTPMKLQNPHTDIWSNPSK